jgi:hypothetical protein
MRLYILSFVLIVLFVGCSVSSNTTHVNENYQWKQNTPKELVIFPIQYDSLTVVNWDDVVDDFDVDSASSKIFIYDTLSQSVVINSISCTQYLTIVDVKNVFNWNEIIEDTSNYFLFEQKIDNKYKPNFLLPKKDLLPSDYSNSYALIIKKILIGRNVNRQPGVPMYMPGQTISTPGGTFQTPGHWGSTWSQENLGARTEFIIWDYEKNEFVKCGMVISKVEFPFGMTTSTWLDLFKTIPLELYEDTPFGIFPVNYYYEK